MGGTVRFSIQVLLATMAVCGCSPTPVRPLSPAASTQSTWHPRGSLPPVAVQTPPGVQNPWKPTASPREWRYIVLHHTASSSGSIESIHESHVGRGWDGIGYHFVIGNGNGMGDGEIQPTFRWREQMHGAHAKSPGNEYNNHGIGICLVGNFEETDPSAAQLASVKRLVGVLKHEYRLSDGQVVAHRDVKATACPGKNFPIGEIGRSSVFSVLAGQPGAYVTGKPASVQIVTVNGSNVR